MSSNSSKRSGVVLPTEEQLLLREMHMKNSITITPSKPSTKYGNKKFIEPVRLTPAWEEKNLPNDVLNFKSVTMEQADLETNPPKDRFLLVYFIILIHGIGILMPWNMFTTAKSYYEDYKLNSNYTHDENLKFYTDNFLLFVSIFSQLPNVVFNWLNIFVNIGGNLTSRIVYSIIVEVIIFILTEVLVLVDTSTWAVLFFWITMGSVFVLNVANGIYQNTIYGVAARLPAAYTGAIILGNNVSGIFTSVMNILTKNIAPAPDTAAVYYFIIALFVLFVCFDTYFLLPLTKFYKYHDIQFQKAQEKSVAVAEETNQAVKTPYWKIFKGCSLQCFNVFYIFFITLTIFPKMFSDVKRSDENFIIPAGDYPDYMCFLTFNIFATLGNLLSTVVLWPGPGKLHIPVLLRTLFLPLFFFSNYRTKDGFRSWPVLIQNDYAFWAIGSVFSFTGGYFSSLSMMYCGKTVAPENSSVAGMFGGACLVTGIFVGLATAFIWPHVLMM